jgi:putative membrane protein
MAEMIGPVVVAWIHYIGIMLLMASLLGEHLLLKQELTVAEARTVQRLDLIYGGSAVLVLVTGIMRMYLEKGTTYYLHSGPFHALLGVFVVVALLSIYPTVVFLRWRADTRAGRGQQLTGGQFKKLQMILRAEMTLLLSAPFFATWMAHGAL